MSNITWATTIILFLKSRFKRLKSLKHAINLFSFGNGNANLQVMENVHPTKTTATFESIKAIRNDLGKESLTGKRLNYVTNRIFTLVCDPISN